MYIETIERNLANSHIWWMLIPEVLDEEGIEPAYAFIDPKVFLYLLEKTAPASIYRDGTQVVYIRVGKTMLFPKAPMVEIDIKNCSG